jgi:hypothetical protein
MANGESTSSSAQTEMQRLQLELDYAWNWFQDSASQRLTAFNFFLVTVGLLAVAYAQGADHRWQLFGMAVGILGAIVSTGFLILDIRNEVLVNKGRAALTTLESRMTIKLVDNFAGDKKLEGERERERLRQALGDRLLGSSIAAWINRKPDNERHRFFRYRFWFRFVISSVGFAFILGAGWAAFDYAPSGPSEAVACRASTVLTLHRPGFDLNLVRRSEREGEQRGGNHDRGRPDHGLGGDLHVQSVGVGDYKRVQTGRHCGKQAVGGG